MIEWLKTWPSWLYDATKGEFTVVAKIFLSIGLILVSYFIIKLLCYLLSRALGIKKKGLEIDRSAKNFFVQALKILLWVLVSFIIVQILGLNLGSFAGILSAITVALGLSLQDIITSFASGLIILNQKHIATGEFIKVEADGNTAEGTVEEIKLMTTLLKTPSGQLIILSNSTLRKAVVTNFTRIGRRRIFLNVPVSYEADPILVKKVLVDIIDKENRILKDPKPDIHYNELSEYSVKVAMKLWTKTDDYWPVLNSLHEKILIGFRKNHIKIPKITDRENIKGE